MRQSTKFAIVVACLLAASAAAIYEAQSVPTMVMTTNAFLASLAPEQREQATFDFGDEERLNWHFIPRERQGLPIKEIEPFQRELGLAMLISGLSRNGFIKATTIMSLEQVLFEQENGRPMRDEELYFFSVFGTPSETDQWGWRFEGHHLALNFTVNNGEVTATTPAFFGANPAEVKEGRQKGLRPLGREEDLARELYSALDADQKKAATIAAEAPRDILMNPDRDERLDDEGVKVSELNDGQQRLLFGLVREYISNMPQPEAREAFGDIRGAGVENIRFAWMGSSSPGEGHYYRVQGPTFIVEYDNIQNTANHIHSVWRDRDDFGVDLLAEHYRASHMKAEE